MVSRRIDAAAALSLMEKGKAAAGKKQLRRVLDTPWGVRIVLAYNRHSDLYREVNKVKAAMLEEIPRLAKASSTATDYAAGMAQAGEAVLRLGDTSNVDRMATVKVLADSVIGLYDPSIGATEEDPAVTLGFLVEIGIPLAAEDYDASREKDEVVVTPSLIAALLAVSDSFFNICLNRSQDLASFYEKKKEAELKNSGPSLDTASPEGSNAANAKSGGSTSSPRQPSGGSTKKPKRKSSADGPANS